MTDGTPDLLQTILRLEHNRPPLTERASLPNFLTQVLEELRSLVPAEQVRCTIEPTFFDPPFSFAISVGTTETMLPPWEHPILWAGTTVATLHIHPAVQEGALEQHVMVLLRTLGEAIAEAHAAEELARRAQHDARRWLSNELHDAVKQVLPAIRLFASSAAESLATRPDRATELLALIREAAQQGEEELTFLLGGMRDHVAEHDLASTLDHLVATQRLSTPDITIDAAFEIPPLSWQVAATTLIVVRNALANVVEHARAQSVTIRVTPDEDGVAVVVHDDGIGLEPSAALAAPGIGMDSSIDRVRKLAGRWNIASNPGSGTRLDVWLPSTQGALPNG